MISVLLVFELSMCRVKALIYQLCYQSQQPAVRLLLQKNFPPFYFNHVDSIYLQQVGNLIKLKRRGSVLEQRTRSGADSLTVLK